MSVETGAARTRADRAGADRAGETPTEARSPGAAFRALSIGDREGIHP